MPHVDPNPTQEIAYMVVKHGVGLGLLSTPKRNMALAVAWSCLPDNLGCSEREMNALIKACLDDACQFLSTDHVELRRWLVDAGWLARDGYGRQYSKVLTAHLPEACTDAAQMMQSLGDVKAWCLSQREQALEARAKAREAWSHKQRSPR